MGSTNNQNPSTTYPPDISCWSDYDDGIWDPAIFEANHCSITENMMNFLNITPKDYGRYITAYCALEPRRDDSCPFGFCPNPDIAGPLVRVANYLTGFCLAILIFYSSKRVRTAYWSQILISYSLLLTCGISIYRKDLTRLHSIVLVSIVCSPVNVYFTGYAVRAFWSTHRLDAVLGRGQSLRRGLVGISVLFWVGILIYTYLPHKHPRFAQDSCRGTTLAENFFLGTPFVIAWALMQEGGAGVLVLLVFLAIPIIVALSWIFAILRKRHDIWPPGAPLRPRFGRVWRTVVNDYPFLQFWSVVAIPTAYWIATVEFGILWGHDEKFSLTFGQVLALFAAVPPIIDVIRLAPDLWHWLTNLPWVLWIGGRWAYRSALDQTETHHMGFIGGKEQVGYNPYAR